MAPHGLTACLVTNEKSAITLILVDFKILSLASSSLKIVIKLWCVCVFWCLSCAVFSELELLGYVVWCLSLILEILGHYLSFFSFFSFTGIPITWMFDHLILSYRSWMLCCFFSHIFISLFSVWVLTYLLAIDFSWLIFYWLILILIDFFLNCIQLTCEPIKGILHLSVLFISHIFPCDSFL